MPPKYSRETTSPLVWGDSLKNRFRTSPCEDVCPAGNPIQKVQSLVEKGDFTEALRYLRARNPFPGITGRVCPHFCQSACNREHFDVCVSIRDLERSAYDHAAQAAPFQRHPATGKKVAVIGGGPAGLSSAFYLALMGHEVTVFESAPLLGGVPRHAIPNFRLPRDIVDREVGWVLDAGVKARVNTTVGKDVSFAQIKDSHNAVLVATGMPAERSLPIPNAHLALKAVEFLRQAALGIAKNPGKNVVIMGGGGVAFDSAFTALRQGAEKVTILCLEKADAMRATPEDLAQAKAEGITVHNACTLSAIAATDNTVTAVDYYEVEGCCFDASGSLKSIPKSNGAHSLQCDSVIFAVGLLPDLGFMDSQKPALTSRNCLQVDDELSCSITGVFAAGEVSLGPSSVAAAIGGGRKAALAIHTYLTGQKDNFFILDEENRISPHPELAGLAPHVVDFAEMYGVYAYPKRDATPQNHAQSHTSSLDFQEITLGLSQEQAIAEAAHCFHCGHCKGCGTCVEDCPGYVLELDESCPQPKPHVAFGEECWHCANCRTSCPCAAIAFEFPLRMQV